MNSLIKQIFENFQVDGVSIPVSFLRYNGKATTYITYQETHMNDTFYGDNKLMYYVIYYDFDIYSKGDYFPIVESLRFLLENNGFRLEPENCSADMYEDETGYYHKTLNFSHIISEEESYEETPEEENNTGNNNDTGLTDPDPNNSEPVPAPGPDPDAPEPDPDAPDPEGGGTGNDPDDNGTDIDIDFGDDDNGTDIDIDFGD